MGEGRNGIKHYGGLREGGRFDTGSTRRRGEWGELGIMEETSHREYRVQGKFGTEGAGRE